MGRQAHGERTAFGIQRQLRLHLVVAAVLDDPSTIGKTIEFSDGHTLITEALEVQP